VCAKSVCFGHAMHKKQENIYLIVIMCKVYMHKYLLMVFWNNSIQRPAHLVIFIECVASYFPAQKLDFYFDIIVYTILSIELKNSSSLSKQQIYVEILCLLHSCLELFIVNLLISSFLLVVALSWSLLYDAQSYFSYIQRILLLLVWILNKCMKKWKLYFILQNTQNFNICGWKLLQSYLLRNPKWAKFNRSP
jgi:hypothetical protein